MNQGQTAVVVGVGPGLGLALGACFAAAGMKVALAARDGARLEAMKPDGEAVRTYACDGTDPGAVAGLFASVVSDLGEPDLVVYNAGSFSRGSVLDIEPDEFERCWRIGCFGGFLVGQAAARRMAERGSGTILFTGATAAMRGGANFLNLSSPKFGLRSLSQSMARELGPRGVHVAHVVVDGQIHSDHTAHMIEEHGPDSLLQPADIAANYLVLHNQRRSAWTQELDLRPWNERF